MKKYEELELIQKEEEQYRALIQVSQQLQKEVEARKKGEFSKRIYNDIEHLKELVKKCRMKKQELEG